MIGRAMYATGWATGFQVQIEGLLRQHPANFSPGRALELLQNCADVLSSRSREYGTQVVGSRWKRGDFHQEVINV